MTLLRAAFVRWLRLVVGLGGGMATLLAATQARRWLAADRVWSAQEAQRLLADGVATLGVVMVVAATLAAVETTVRMRRDGVLATLCVSSAGLRRFAGIAVASALATGVVVAVAASLADRLAEAPAALVRVAEGWRWQPWPSIAPMTLGAAADAGGMPSGDDPARALLAGGAGAAAVAAAFAFGATTTARGRLLPHVLALDGLALGAALWLAAPAAAVGALALAGAALWRVFAARGPRRTA